MKKILIFAFVFLLANFSAAVDEKALNNCLCWCGCQEGAGWDCSVVSCYYNPAAVDASPACADASGGECVCQGFGCGRAAIPTSGSCYDGCMNSYGEVTCAEGEVVLENECVKESEACTGGHQEYDYYTKSCKCELGYYLRDGECLMPNRERKNHIDGMNFETFKGVYGQTFSKTYTFTARTDAVGDTVFYVGEVWPAWMKDAVSIQPSKLYLKPGESGSITVTINADPSIVNSDPYISIGFVGLDDKYQFVDHSSMSLTLSDPEVAPEVNEVVQDNTEIYNEEVPEPPIAPPLESSGNLFEDVKRAIRVSGFGEEEAAKMESIIDMYSDDSEGEKNLITALAAVGMIPADEMQSALTVYSEGATTMGELTYAIVKTKLDSEAEESLKQVVDITGMLTVDAKGQLYKNLGKVIPQLLQHKYQLKQAHNLVRENIKRWEKENEPLSEGE
ncbi:MAG: hypothetical protein ABIH99_01075 [Candidatus Micrarchaeota archaeon]